MFHLATQTSLCALGDACSFSTFMRTCFDFLRQKNWGWGTRPPASPHATALPRYHHYHHKWFAIFIVHFLVQMLMRKARQLTTVRARHTYLRQLQFHREKSLITCCYISLNHETTIAWTKPYEQMLLLRDRVIFVHKLEKNFELDLWASLESIR